MQDLRKTLNVNNNNKPNREFSFKPLKWLRRNWKNILTLGVIFLLVNLLFNPGGVSKFISGWLSDFLNNWNI